jgi:hypothetical protein
MSIVSGITNSLVTSLSSGFLGGGVIGITLDWFDNLVYLGEYLDMDDLFFGTGGFTGMDANSDFTRFYALDNHSNELGCLNLGTAKDISTATIDLGEVLDVGANSTVINPSAVLVFPDETGFWLADWELNVITVWEGMTAGDPSTATVNVSKELDVSTWVGEIRSMKVLDDGFTLKLGGSTPFSDMVTLSMSTAWDLSTLNATPVTSYRFGGVEYNQGWDYNEDGTEIIMGGRSDIYNLKRIPLTIPYDEASAAGQTVDLKDLRTLTGDKVLAGFTDIIIDTESLRMYVMDLNENGIFVFRLGMPALTLSAATVEENTAVGTSIGTIQNGVAGSTYSLSDDAGGSFSVSGTSLKVGANGVDYEAGATQNITIVQTNDRYLNSPSSTTLAITVTNVSDAVPEAFTVLQWDAEFNGAGDEIDVTISEMPNVDGATVTNIEYRLDGGSWVSGGITGIGTFSITGVSSSNEYDLELRVISANGNGAVSDLKVILNGLVLLSTVIPSAVLDLSVSQITSFDGVDDILRNIETNAGAEQSDYNFDASALSLVGTAGTPTAYLAGDGTNGLDLISATVPTLFKNFARSGTAKWFAVALKSNDGTGNAMMLDTRKADGTGVFIRKSGTENFSVFVNNAGGSNVAGTSNLYTLNSNAVLCFSTNGTTEYKFWVGDSTTSETISFTWPTDTAHDADEAVALFKQVIGGQAWDSSTEFYGVYGA